MTYECEVVEASDGDIAVVRINTMNDVGICIATRFELFVGTRFVAGFGASDEAMTAFNAEIDKRPSPLRGLRM